VVWLRSGCDPAGEESLAGPRYNRWLIVPEETTFVSATADSAPLDRAAVFEIVRANLADILEIEQSTITEGQSFVDDLDADSLALIELVEALEEDLSERSVGFRIEDEDLVDLKTVRDAVDYVLARVQEA
jgi:acyl carrier protein